MFLLCVHPFMVACFLFLLALANGMLDSILLETGKRQTVVFPGEVMMPQAVQKASFEAALPSLQEAVFTEHRVKKEESLSRIAYHYGLTPATLISVNQLRHPSDVKFGRILLIPYRDGRREKALNNESFGEALFRLDVEEQDIQKLPDGDFFIAGNADIVIPEAFVNNMFRYPVDGLIMSAYGTEMDPLTGIPYKSDGISLAADAGNAVVASRGGTVLLTGNHSSYGLYVIMGHKNDWKTFYGSMGRVDVAPGDVLAAGTAIGTAGQSGTARRPGVHFILIHDDEIVDPLNYLY